MKKYIIACIAVVMTALSVRADNLSVLDVKITENQTKTIGISLKNYAGSNYVSFQMDLTLPEGVTINKEGCELTSRIVDEDQELIIGKIGDNKYRLISTSYSLNTISGYSGEIIMLSLKASEGSSSGVATISNIHFVKNNSTRVDLDDVSFNISIIKIIKFADPEVKSICVSKWDTNADGELDNSEASAVVKLDDAFKGNVKISSFDEFQYFTKVTNTEDAFNGCSALTTVKLSGSISKIGVRTFSGCSNLKSITIPESVSSIEIRAFQGCTSLSKVDVPSNVSTIGEGAFSNCTGLTTLNIANGVKSIYSYAFTNCTSLKTVLLPSSITGISFYVFDGCPLETIIVDLEKPLSISSKSFSDDLYNNATLYVPAGCKSAYMDDYYWKKFKNIVEMGQGGIIPTNINTQTNAIYANAAYGLKGGEGTLTICLKNEQPTCAYNFDLLLPTGVTLAKDNEGDYVYTLSIRHNGHAPSVSYKPSTGLYSFEVLSPNSKEIKDNDGVIWTLKINVADNVDFGDYAVKIQNAKYSLVSSSTTISMPEITSVLSVVDYKQGDANGDGKIDITDAFCLINYLVGKGDVILNVEAFDVNGDGVIDIADSVSIVNLVVGKIPAFSRTKGMNIQELVEGIGPE